MVVVKHGLQNAAPGLADARDGVLERALDRAKDGESVLGDQARVRREELRNFGEGELPHRGRVVVRLQQERRQCQGPPRHGRRAVGRRRKRLGWDGDGWGDRSAQYTSRTSQGDTLFVVKDVLVALLATCLPLPSLSFAFCPRNAHRQPLRPFPAVDWTNGKVGHAGLLVLGRFGHRGGVVAPTLRARRVGGAQKTGAVVWPKLDSADTLCLEAGRARVTGHRVR